jgi:hypothetical protein
MVKKYEIASIPRVHLEPLSISPELVMPCPCSAATQLFRRQRAPIFWLDSCASLSHRFSSPSVARLARLSPLFDCYLDVAKINRTGGDSRLKSTEGGELYKTASLEEWVYEIKKVTFWRLISRSLIGPNIARASFNAGFWIFAPTCLI